MSAKYDRILTKLETVQLSRPRELNLSILEFAQKLGFTLDPWQADLLIGNDDRVIVNTCRQSGKSSMAAVMGLFTALVHPGSLVLILSPSLRQSSELFKKVVRFYKDLGCPIKPEEWTGLTLQLENGSRIVSLPGQEQTIRGYSGVSLLIIDEASRVDDSLYFSVRPMLAVSRGRIILLSTPWGKRGFFFETWQYGQGWRKFQVTARECPRIAPEFLEEERRAIGSYWFDQEYLCQFKENELAAFGYDEVQAAFDEEVTPWSL